MRLTTTGSKSTTRYASALKSARNARGYAAKGTTGSGNDSKNKIKQSAIEWTPSRSSLLSVLRLLLALRDREELAGAG